MIPQLKIELTPQAQKILDSLHTLPSRMTQAIAQGMNQANQLAAAKIQREHLSGHGPFPPPEHRLGVVTNRLRSSVWVNSAQPASGGQMQSAIGSNVIYAAIHEFGGRIHHGARKMKLRQHADARGNLVKQLGNADHPVFAGAQPKRVRATPVRAGAYDVIMPERAPFRTGLAESAPLYQQTISAAILAEWQKIKS